MIWILGRILSRLSKDQDTLDSELPIVLMQVCIMSHFTGYVLQL